MAARFDIEPTLIDGVLRVARKPVGDARGYLERVFCSEELSAAGAAMAIRQVNRTLTEKRGTVRGLHFQRAPGLEAKLVSCLKGRVFDVAVDLRKGSPTFLKWHGEILSGDNHRSLVIPEGCAHGFQTLAGDCEMLYFHSADYAPEAEGGINPLEALLAISWPEAITAMSPRDAAHPALASGFEGLSR